MIKKRKPNTIGRSNATTRALLGILFLLTSIFIAFFVLPFFYGERSITDSVVVAAQDIKKGDVIENHHLRTKVIGTYGLEGYFVDRDLIVGRVATFDMAQGDTIIEGKIAGRDDDVLLFLPVDGRGLLTITVKSNAAGLAAHLRKGALVNVYNVIDITNETQDVNEFGGITVRKESVVLPVLNPLLTNMEIYSIENSNAVPIRDGRDHSGSSEGNNSNTVNTITFYTTSIEQELELLKAEYDGIIHVSLVEL